MLRSERDELRKKLTARVRGEREERMRKRREFIGDVLRKCKIPVAIVAIVACSFVVIPMMSSCFQRQDKKSMEGNAQRYYWSNGHSHLGVDCEEVFDDNWQCVNEKGFAIRCYDSSGSDDECYEPK